MSPRLRLAGIVAAGWADLQRQYGARLDSRQVQALRAIEACRTGAFGQLQLGCGACGQQVVAPLSCGHRSCPRCQNHVASQWLDRQRRKLLPVPYFMVTFTLPAQLRPLARDSPETVYKALFDSAIDTLRSFGRRNAGIDQLGLCAVLHTQTRRLDYHPHVHVIVVGGGLDRHGRVWTPTQRDYLFNAGALAEVFRGKLLATLKAAALALPSGIPTRWILDCRAVGHGAPALDYLSRYLYRGVLSEHDLVALDRDHGTVTFRYREGRAGEHKGRTRTRTLPIATFLYLLTLHVLPTGFHRVRDYGFLHGNAKAKLQRLQLLLRVWLIPQPPPERPAFRCPCCDAPMRILGITRRRLDGS